MTSMLNRVIGSNMRKQPSGGVPKKSCFEIMQQIYRGTPTLKWGLFKTHFSIGVLL